GIGGGGGGGGTEGLPSPEEWKSLSDLDRAMINVEGVAQTLYNQYGETEKSKYIKGLTEFVMLLKPSLEGRVKDRDAFNTRMAKVFRNALSKASDKEVVDAVMSRFREIRQEGQSVEDSLAHIQKFISTLSLDQEQKDRIYPTIKAAIDQERRVEVTPTPSAPTPSAPISGEVFQKMLTDPGKMISTLKQNPEGLSALMFQAPLPDMGGTSEGEGGVPGKAGIPISPEEWKNLSKLDRAVTNVERVAQSLFNLHGEKEKSQYLKGLTEFIILLKPTLEAKVEDREAFNARMAKVLRNAFARVPDKDLVDAVMSRFQEIRQEGKTEDDSLALIRKFVSTLSLDPERKEQVYPALEAGLAQEMGKSPTAPASPGAAPGLGVPSGGKFALLGEETLGDISITHAEHIRGGEAVLLAKDSVEELKTQIKDRIELEDVDQIMSPFIKALEDPSPEIRKRAAESVGELLVSLLTKEKFQASDKLLKTLKENLEKEESFEVYLAYVSVMEKVARIMREKGQDEISDEIQGIFTDQISSESKRKRAIQALGKVGGRDALASLLSALWESGIYKEVREAIVQMGKEAMPLIIDIYLEAEDRTLRRRIHDLIIHIGKEAIEPLLPTLEDERWNIRRESASILKVIGDPSAIKPLSRLLKDPHELVRMEAFNGIGKIGGEDAEKSLLEILKEGEPRARLEAIRTLGKIGEDLSVQALSDLLTQEENQRIQKEICRVLGQIGKDQAIEPLKNILAESSFLGRSKYSDDIRVSAIFALAKIGGEVVQEELQRLTEDKNRQIQLAAQSALKRLQDTG
ncbi:HEAT repeat domain-containing protein, partial [candidate division TA06 bacterium]|nr:HEAT repeat domain-containing protein [candidate division TA06 bacterium]